MYGLWWVFIGVAMLTLLLFIIGTSIQKKTSCNNDTGLCIEIFSGIIGGIASAILLGCCIFNPIKARKDIIEFNYTKIMVEQVISSGNDLENIAISQNVVDMNVWLSEAKARKEAYGILCAYNADDLSALSPIQIP